MSPGKRTVFTPLPPAPDHDALERRILDWWEENEVFDRLRAINRAGVTTVLVEQNVKAALAIADRAVILVEGRIAHEGPCAALADDPIVAELYLGARREGAPA